jgi:O-antigen/teichoic acid export membrane protein
MSRNELWGQSGQYLVVKILASGINLIGFALYTRLLTTEQYGHYSLVITGSMLAGLVFFNWLKLGLLRFFPAHRDAPVGLLSTVAGLFVMLAVLAGLLITAATAIWPRIPLHEYFLVGFLLLLAQSWLNNNLEISRAELNPRKFGLLTIVQAATGVATAVCLAVAGFGAGGVLIGLTAGFLVPSLYLSGKIWGRVRFREFDPSLLREMLAYGIPLSITASLAFVLAGADRFMIKALIGDGPVGLYSSAYDLGHHSLAVICMTVGLAGTPLAINALERGGWEEAKRQYLHNGTLFLALAIPAAGGLVMTGPLLIRLLLGEEFRFGATTIFPWVVLGVLFQSAKFYYLDSAFYLHKNTRIQVWIVLPAAILNIVLNFFLLPRVGIVGAAWATAASYFFALAVSLVYVQLRLRMPVPWRQGLRILLAGAVMMVGLWLAGTLGVRFLAIQIPLGVVLYLGAAWVLHVADIRAAMVAAGRRLRSEGSGA